MSGEARVSKVVALRRAVAGLVRDGALCRPPGAAKPHPDPADAGPDLPAHRHGLGRPIFSRGGNPASLPRFRDAAEHGWPELLELEELSHAWMANRYVAGNFGLTFAALRGLIERKDASSRRKA